MSLSLTFDNAYYDKKVKQLNSITNTIDNNNNILYWDVDANGTEVLVNIDINNITANSVAGFTIEAGLLYPNNIFIKSLVKNITLNMKKATFLIDKVKPQKNIVFYIKLVHIRNFQVVISNVTINNTIMISTTQDIINNRMAKPVYTRGIVDIITPFSLKNGTLDSKINMANKILTLDRRAYKNIVKQPVHLKKL